MRTREEIAWKWARFVVGVMLIAAMLVVHAFFKELSVFWIALPGVLLGVKPEALIDKVRGK